MSDKTAILRTFATSDDGFCDFYFYDYEWYDLIRSDYAISMNYVSDRVTTLVNWCPT